MTENVKEQMIESGFDYDNAVYRFLGNEQMYHKFLKKLLDFQLKQQINGKIL